MPEPDRRKAQDEGERDVDARELHLAVAHEVERLQAEGREGGVAAANARHHELAGFGAHQIPAVWAGEGGEESDDEGADDVDRQGAEREGLAEMVGGETRAPIARSTSERAPYRHPDIHHRSSLLPGWRPSPRPPAIGRGRR